MQATHCRSSLGASSKACWTSSPGEGEGLSIKDLASSFYGVALGLVVSSTILTLALVSEVGLRLDRADVTSSSDCSVVFSTFLALILVPEVELVVDRVDATSSLDCLVVSSSTMLTLAPVSEVERLLGCANATLSSGFFGAGFSLPARLLRGSLFSKSK